jgi:hypothetical protein
MSTGGATLGGGHMRSGAVPIAPAEKIAPARNSIITYHINKLNKKRAPVNFGASA